MSDFDIFPTLEEPAPQASAVAKVAVQAPAAVVTSVKDAVLAQFKATEPVLKALVARYANVAIDVSTPKGLADAKAARHDLRKNGRFVVQNARDDLKAEINALKPVIESEAERLIAMVKPTEDAYDVPITEREAVLAAEKAERERIEAERVAGHRANIAVLAGYVGQAQGRTSDQIQVMINQIDAVPILPEQWEEFAVGAEIQKGETLEALQALFDRTKTAEDEAAAREQQRIENERKAAELTAREAELAAKQAAIDAQLAKIAAAEKAEADRIAAAAQAQRDAEAKAQAAADAATRQATEDEANRLAQEATAEESVPLEQMSDDALDARPEIPAAVPAVAAPAADMDEVAAKPWAMPAGPVTVAEPTTPATNEEPSLTLGAINARFGAGFTMTAAFVTDVLGVPPAGTKKAAVLFRPSQLTHICDALVELANAVCNAD